VDVSKARLDVFERPAGQRRRSFPNEDAGSIGALVGRLKEAKTLSW
jgi:hypothetical protein